MNLVEDSASVDGRDTSSTSDWLISKVESLREDAVREKLGKMDPRSQDV